MIEEQERAIACKDLDEQIVEGDPLDGILIFLICE